MVLDQRRKVRESKGSSSTQLLLLDKSHALEVIIPQILEIEKHRISYMQRRRYCRFGKSTALVPRNRCSHGLGEKGWRKMIQSQTSPFSIVLGYRRERGCVCVCEREREREKEICRYANREGKNREQGRQRERRIYIVSMCIERRNVHTKQVFSCSFSLFSPV